MAAVARRVGASGGGALDVALASARLSTWVWESSLFTSFGNSLRSDETSS